MKKCQELASVLVQEYRQLEKQRKIPKLELKKTGAMSEGFHSQMKAGILQLGTCNELAQVYGISQMGVAVRSGYIREFLGETVPRFGLRPLWIGSQKLVEISSKVGLYVPAFMCEPDAELLLPRFCRYLLECGYNSLVIGSFCKNALSQKENIKIDLKGFFRVIAGHGIQVIVKPEFYLEAANTCPYDSIFREQLKETFDEFFKNISETTHLFWESRLLTSKYRHHVKAQEATEAEVILEEVKLIENCIQDRSHLIFYIPALNEKAAQKQSEWFSRLMDDMGKKTILSFSAVSGSFWEDHQSEHPFWKILRTSLDTSSTPLLPIVNAGLINQGEGFWPIWNCDLLDRFFSRCRNHKFAGIIIPAKHLPARNSILDGNLWTAGQSMWREMPSQMLMETWFTTHRVWEDFEENSQILKLGSSIVKDVSLLKSIPRKSLSSEECRQSVEYVLAQLKRMQRFFKNEQKQKEHVTLAEYFSFFAEDVKSFLDQFLQNHQVPSFQYFQGENPQGTFWLKKGTFLESPERGQEGSLMEKIYLENCWL